MTGRRRDARGSVAPLVIGLAVVVAMLVAVVVDVSAAFLRREALNAAADAAALAATDGLQGDLAYRGGLGERGEIDVVAARRYVAEHLRATAARERFPGLTWTVAAEGDAVVVHLRTPYALPLRVPGSEAVVEVGASSSAVVVIVE